MNGIEASRPGASRPNRSRGAIWLAAVGAAVALADAPPPAAAQTTANAPAATAVSGLRVSGAQGSGVQGSGDAPSPTAGAGTAAGGPDTGLEQVTVTAERRAQSAQSVGSSISAISSGTLRTHNVNDVFDLQYLTPSLQVTPQFGSGQPSFAIRGLGFDDYASNNAPTVGIYQDEVSLPVPFATNEQTFDIQRVEVLRGPQGTLYGRNTTGGAINYVLNKPTPDLLAGLDVQYGRFDGSKVDGYVSGPLSGSVRFRLSGETQHGGAFEHDRDGSGAVLGDVNRNALRLLLDADATDTLKVELNLHGSHDRSDSSGLHLYAPLTAINDYRGTTAPVLPADTDRYATGWGTSPVFAREIGIQPDQKPFSHVDTAGASLRLDQALGFATLTNLASEDYAQRTEYDNFDASPQSVSDVYYNSRADVFSDELRLTSRGTGPFGYVAGIFYSNEFLSDIYRSGFDDLFGLEGNVPYSQTVNTISGFGQANYRIARALTLVVGGRIEHESRRLNNFTSQFLANDVLTNPDDSVGPRSTDFTLPSGRVELEYSPVRRDLVYVSVSRGIKSGGFTTYNSPVPATSTDPFKPERVLAYEVGNKLELPAQHLRLNVSAFYYDYHDEQVLSEVVNPAVGPLGVIVNAPRSHLYGGEFEADWTPVRHLTLTQSGGWATGQFDEFNTTVGDVLVGKTFFPILANRKGDSLPAPKITLNGSVSYSWDIGRFVLTTEGDYSLRTTDRSLFGPLFDVAGYTLFNTSVALSPRTNRWTLAAFGQNILDKRYDITRNFFVDGDDIALAGLPATWGVRLSVNY